MIQDIKLFLKDCYPFSELQEGVLDYIAGQVIIRFHPSGSILFQEGGEPLNYVYLVRKGAVSLVIGNIEVDFLCEGDFFGYPSLLSGNPPTSTAVVKEDAILYLFPKDVFLKLMGKYQVFESYFTKNLAKKLATTLSRVKPITKDRTTIEKLMMTRFRDIPLKQVPILKPDSTVSECAKIMKEKNLTAVFVGLKEPFGIITERDIIKKVLAEGRDPGKVKLKEIMSSPIFHVREDSFVFEAILEMARRNFRRVAISDSEGKIVGLFEDTDVIALESKNILVIVKEIEKAANINDLIYMFNLTVELIRSLVSEGANIVYISRLISEINDKIMARTARLTMEQIGSPVPCKFSIMALGSEGRKEQTLKTDQDNALIFEDCDNEYFLEFGKLFTENLLKIGFPPCPGNVMTSNPEWVKSRSEWIKSIENWMLSPKPDHTLKMGIFFDFRSVYGEEILASELKNHIFKLIDRSDIFIRYMILDAIRFKPPIGRFRKFILERKGEHKGAFDIKKGGIFPITQGIRALSLKEKIPETNTIERINRLVEKKVLPGDLAENLKEAYNFLQTLRLKAQVEKLNEKKTIDNYISPENLSKLEHSLLKDSLRIVENFQSFLDRTYSYFILR